MQIRIIINALEVNNDNPDQLWRMTSEVFRGDIDILKETGRYITKISIIAEGEPQPICDIPFSLAEGHYMWIPPDMESENDDEEPISPQDYIPPAP